MVSYEYIAGFFDGEGYCSIMKRSPGGHSRSPYWVIASMTNTHKEVLDEIQQICGGKVIFHHGGYRHNRPHYRLTFYTQQAVNFIKAIRPYLVIKQIEADLVIAFDDYMKQSSYYYGGMKMTEKELKIRDSYYIQMKALHGNRIGKRRTLPIRGSKST
jgi:hypothetical protein